MTDLRNNIYLEEVALINFINLTREEAELLLTWRNDENIRKWMYTDHVISSEEHRIFLERIKTDSRNFYWVIKDKGDNYLGVVSLNRVDFRNKNAYFAIYANPYLKVPGAGRMLDEIVINVAFEILKLHSLRLEVIEDNTGVINLHKKMGFKEEGRLKGYIFKYNIWKDVIIMGKINENVRKG